MAIATLTSKGQLTVPKAVRDFLDLKPGDKVEIMPEADGRVTMRRLPVRSIRDLFGMLPAGILPASDEALEEMIGDAVAEGALRRP